MSDEQDPIIADNSTLVADGSFHWLLFWKERPNGSRYRRLNGCVHAHETDKTQSREKGQFGGENPAVRVHALLGVFCLNTRFPFEKNCVIKINHLLISIDKQIFQG